MKNRKSIIALLLVAIIGVIGLTIAYFANSTDVENEFETKPYGTEYTEQFVSPDNWLPGTTTPKTIIAENTGEVDQAVRISFTESWTTDNKGTLSGWIHPDGTKSTHTTENELATDERVAVINFTSPSEWTKVGDYYYYNYKLAPEEETSSLIQSVAFNPKTKLDDTCTPSTNSGVTTITCNSSGDDYDNATYTLTFTIETVQYNKYNDAWNLNNTVTIATEKPVPASQYLAENATNPANTVYDKDNLETKGNMFVFTHGEGANTVTETRYIGNAPKNYVYFNCDNDGTNCEIWRILGVFDVDDGTGNVEQRMKLVRGSLLYNYKEWNIDGTNDWINASLKNFLNGDYYNRIGDAATNGLKASAQAIIDDAVYYLGAYVYNTNVSAKKLYVNERGTTLCGACNSDATKLTWTGKVGLMYPSDEYMVYGNGVNSSCYNFPDGCRDTNATTGWVYNSNIRDGGGPTNQYSTWLLSTSSENVNRAFNTTSVGVWYGSNVTEIRGVRPVVYLKSNVQIDSGTGTELDPYKLK